jgi:hypothetical protein
MMAPILGQQPGVSLAFAAIVSTTMAEMSQHDFAWAVSLGLYAK